MIFLRINLAVLIMENQKKFTRAKIRFGEIYHNFCNFVKTFFDFTGAEKSGFGETLFNFVDF